MFKVNNSRVLYRYVRLCPINYLTFKEFNEYKPLLLNGPLSHSYLIQCNSFSFQSTVESYAKTQTGVFKTLSESTPVEYTQKLLLTLHDITGLPWWATIITTTILLRSCVTLPLTVYQYYILAKLENLKLEMPEIVKELKRETALAIRMYHWDEKKARITYNRSIRKQWNNLIVRENCHPLKASLLLWFQIPMWISLSIALRNLVYMLPEQDIAAKLTYAELTMGGFGFIPNLTEIDSSLILPVALGLINLIIIEIQVLARLDASTKLQKYITNFFRVFSVLMVPIAASVPSCLVLYWTTSSTFGLFQNLILLSPNIKRLCGIPKTSRELEHPYRHIVKGIRNKFKLKSD